MTPKQKITMALLCSLFLIPIYGAYSLSHTILTYNVAHAQTDFKIPDIQTSGDKQDQIIQLQKQTNKELAIIACTDYRNNAMYTNHYLGSEWGQKEYDCVNKVLSDTK